MKNKRGILEANLGEIIKKVVTALAITFFFMPSKAKSWHYIFGGNWHYVSRHSRPYYTPQAFGRRLPDGRIHSGYVAADTHYSMRAKSHEHSGLVSRWWYRLPSGLKDRIPPRDWGNYDVAKEYARRFFVPESTLVKKIEKEGPSYEQRLATGKARTAQLKKEAEQRKQQEGLDEPALFRSYFESIGIDRKDYDMALMKMDNQTVALDVTFRDYPLFVIAWNDPTLMKENSQRIGRRGFCGSYRQKLEEFIKQGKTVCEITETDQIQLTSKLERTAVQYLR